MTDRKNTHNEELQVEILQQKTLVEEKFHIVTSLTLRIDTLEAQIKRNDMQISREKEKIMELRDEMNDTNKQELRTEIKERWNNVHKFEAGQEALHKQVNALQDELGEHKANGRIITMRYRDLISREKTFQGVLLETLLDRLG